MQEEVERLDHRLKNHLSNHTDDGLREDMGIILKRGAERWKGFKEWGGKEAFSFGYRSAMLVDIGQHSRNEPDISICDAEDLDLQLREARSVEKAKKRFQSVRSIEMGNSRG